MKIQYVLPVWLMILLVACAPETENSVSLLGTMTLEGQLNHADISVHLNLEGGKLIDSTTTNEKGEFVFRQISMVPYELTFIKDGFLTTISQARWNGSAHVIEGDSELESLQASLKGLVASQNGARNDWPNIAFVTLTNEASSHIAPVANANGGKGQFQFDSVPQGTWTVNVTVQGHAPVNREVDLRSGENTLADTIGEDTIVLLPDDRDAAVVLRGQVQLQGVGDGGNHGGVEVKATVQGNLVTTAQSANDGGFAFLASRQQHTLSFSKQGFAPQEVELVWDEVEKRFEDRGVAFDSTTIDLRRLAFEGAIHVSVNVEPNWIPAGQRTVTVHLVRNGEASQTRTVLDSDLLEEGETESFESLPPGRYTLSVERSGFSRAERTIEISQGDPGQTTSLSIVLDDLRQANLDLQGVTLTGDDLRSIGTLQGADLAGVNLDGADLSCLNLRGVHFNGANLNGADLRGTDLTRADFRQASLEGARLHPKTINLDFQVLDFDRFGSLHTNTETRKTEHVLMLVPDEPNTRGSAWHLNQKPVVSGFETIFSARVTGHDEDNPLQQGFAFVLHNSSGRLNSLGGGDFGFVGLPNSLAVQFLNNSVAVYNNGTNRNCIEGCRLGRSEREQLGLFDGQLRDFRIRYQANILEVFVGNAPTPLVSVELVLDELLDLNDGRAWVGFTSANPGDVSQRSDIAHWTFGTTAEACEGNNRGTLLTNADFSGADLTGVYFSDYPRLSGLPCNGPRPEVMLNGVNFLGASLNQAVLADMDLSSFDLSNQNFTEASLVGACLQNTQLSLANLSGVLLNHADLSDANLVSVLLLPSNRNGDEIPASLHNTDMSGSVASEALIERADMSFARLVGANLNGASIVGTDLSGVDATGASLLDVIVGTSLPDDCVLPDDNTALPVARWTFDQENLRDDTVNAVHGVGVNLRVDPFEDSPDGQALSLNRSHGYVKVDGLRGLFETGNPFAIEVGFKTGETRGQKHENILFSVNGSGIENHLRLGIGERGGVYFNGTLDNVNDLELGEGFDDNRWHDLELSISPSGNLTTRVDGQLLPAFIDSLVAWEDATRFSIGQEWDGDVASDHFEGEIEGITIWGRCNDQNFIRCETERLPPSCRVQETTLEEAVMAGTIMVGAFFDGTVLINTDFTHADLRQSTFQGVDYQGVRFSNARLSGANLRGERLVGADFIGADFEGADLSEANLTGAMWSNCRWDYDANCTFSERHDCLLGACTSVRMSGADLRGATVDSTTNMTLADLSSTDLSQSRLVGLRLDGAYLFKANFSGSEILGGTFGGAFIVGGDLSRTFIVWTSASKADFRDASFSGGYISCDFEGADFSDGPDSVQDRTGASFVGSELVAVDFIDANLSDATFLDAITTNIDVQGATFDRTRCPDGRFSSEFPLCGF